MMVEFRVSDKLFGLIPGGVFGIFSVLVGVIGDILAASFFPGYTILSNMISDLGIGPGGIFFNIGVLLAGLFAIPYMISLGRFSNNKDGGNRTIIKVAVVSSIISSLALSMIGIVPAYRDSFMMILIHGIIAAICYIGAAGYLFIYSNIMFKDERFPNIFAYIAFIDAILFICVLFTWYSLIQWIANIFIILWTLLVASYLVYKGKHFSL